MRVVRESHASVVTILLLYGLLLCVSFLLAMSLPMVPSMIVAASALLLIVPTSVGCVYYRQDDDDPMRPETTTPISVTTGVAATAFWVFSGIFVLGAVDILTVLVGATITAYGLSWATVRVAEPLLAAHRRVIAANDYSVCEGCAYDLRGNLSGRCPECGTARRCVRCGRPAHYVQDGVCIHCGHSWATDPAMNVEDADD